MNDQAISVSQDAPVSLHLDLLRAVNRARGGVKEVCDFYGPRGGLSPREAARLAMAMRHLEAVAESVRTRVPQILAMIAEQQRQSAAAARYGREAELDSFEAEGIMEDEEPLRLSDLEPDVPFNAVGEDEEPYNPQTRDHSPDFGDDNIPF